MKKKFLGKYELIFIVVGIISITLLMNVLHLNNNSKDISIYLTSLLSILVSLFIWLGCRLIVSYLWNKYPWEKNPLKHLIIEIIAIPAWATLVMFGSVVVYIYTNNPLPPNDSGFNSFALGLLITLLITSIHEGIYFYQQWKENFNLSLKLKKDNLEARYETLKAQLNPHFLFNSLNTLITYVDDNPKASEYVQNLSDFMRYVLKKQRKRGDFS